MQFNIIDTTIKADFSSSKIDKRMGISKWGKNNLYPKYLLDLYNNEGSSIHKAIINKKIKMILDKGFSTDFNISDRHLNQLIKKIATDYEIFNGFSYEVLKSRDGSTNQINYIPFSGVRLSAEDNEEGSDYSYKNDWSDRKEDKKYFVDVNSKSKKHNKLFYYQEFNPDATNDYPTVQYSTTINWISLDYKISVFHIGQVDNSFMPSTIINIANIPSEDEQVQFDKAIKNNFASEKNSGKIIITYSDGKDNAPEIIPFELNATDKRFLLLMKQINENIVIGHEVPPNLLITTAGKLGGDTDRDAVIGEFKETYIEPRTMEIISALEESFQTTITKNII